MSLCRAGQSGQPAKEKHIPADPNSARSAKLAAKRAKAKEVRAAKKATAKARKQRAAERADQQTGNCGNRASHPSAAAMNLHFCQAGVPLRHPQCLCSTRLRDC